MSDAVFPTLAGQKIDLVKEPIWSTVFAVSASQMETRGSYLSYPRYRITLAFEVLRATPSAQEYQALLGFFNSRGGALESFLWQDPDDRTATDQVFGTGDGITTVFRLGRALGGAWEPVSAVAGAPVIKKAGVPQGASLADAVESLALDFVTSSYQVWANDYSFDANTAIVTFHAPPAAGAALTWSGEYLRRVRFESDSMSLKRFLAAMYSADGVKLLTVKT